MLNNILDKIDDNKLKKIVLCIFFLQPILELDYLLVDYLGSIPRPSTVFHIIIIPLLVLLVYLKKEDKKFITALAFGSYLLVLGFYYLIHSRNCVSIFDSLYLTNNFKFTWFGEFVYIYTLVIPYFIIYAFYKTEIKEIDVEKYIVIISLTISLLIVLGDLFLFGLSTYAPTLTVKNIFSWFNNDPEELHPKFLSSKFYFPEGNTLGIYLFSTLPILYSLLAKAKENKTKILMVVTLVLQSLAMIIVSTRIATYGAIIMPVACLFVYLLFVILKKVNLNIWMIITCSVIACSLFTLLPYSPAYVNQQLNNANEVAVLNDNYLLEEARRGVGGKELVPGTAEYNYYYIYYFEDWGIRANLISSVSKEYYIDYYNYKFDAKFWWDMLDLYSLEERCNGRQVQTIFNNYKWNKTNTKTKLLGMGYTTFMNGSFLIEQDFVQQRYTLGYIGDFITVGPWACIGLYGIYKILADMKNKFDYTTITYAISFCAILASGIVSGHTLDQYLTTTLLAIVCSVLLHRVNQNG